MPSTRTFFDHSAIRRVSAWALLYRAPVATPDTWRPAGRVLVGLPRDGAGVVHARIEITEGPWRMRPDGEWVRTWSTGSAHGCGYDKASAAVADAADQLTAGHPAWAALRQLGGAGMSTVRAAFEAAGYTVVEVL